MLTVLIDTNVMLVAISPRSNLHWLYKALIEKKYKLVVSNEILLEYQEQMLMRYGDTAIAEFLLILAEAANVVHVEPYFRWNLIKADDSDNKFVDAYVSSGADYIITHDRHFDLLKQLGFPLIKIVDAYSFKEILESEN